MPLYQAGFEAVPGQLDSDETLEIDLTWRSDTKLNIWDGGYLLASATDAGHSGNTSRLRAGLLLGQITATGKWTTWAPTASDGSERICGVLGRMKNLTEGVDKFAGSIITGGFLKADNLIIPGNASAGIVGDALEYVVRDLLGERFILDDRRNSLVPRLLTLTADKTIDGNFHNTVIDNAGAAGTVIVTLPAPQKGFRLKLHQVSNQILRVGTPSAGQLKLSDATTAQTLDLPAATNKIMEIRGISASLYQAVIYGATS